MVDYLINNNLLDDFIACIKKWKMDFLMDDLLDFIDNIPDYILDDYIYNGVAYRCLVTHSTGIIYDQEMTSWSLDLDYCDHFLYNSSHFDSVYEDNEGPYTGIILKSNIKGFNLDKIIVDLFEYRGLLSEESQSIYDYLNNEYEVLAPLYLENCTILKEIDL